MICGCGCISSGWPASWPRSGRPICGFPGGRRGGRAARPGAGYLLAEMLDRQRADVQDVLLRTSLLDRVNGELADVLTGRPGSDRILLELADANGFVVPLDPERMWFRYHHLFGDLLPLELRRTLPEDVPTLHRRA